LQYRILRKPARTKIASIWKSQQNEYADSNQDMKFEKRRSNYNDNDNFGKRDSYNKKYDRGNRQRQGGYQEDGF